MKRHGVIFSSVLLAVCLSGFAEEDKTFAWSWESEGTNTEAQAAPEEVVAAPDVMPVEPEAVQDEAGEVPAEPEAVPVEPEEALQVEAGEVPAEPEAVSAETEQAPVEAEKGDGFSWSWEEEGADIKAVEAVTPEEGVGGTPIAPDAYKELIRENLNLRRQLSDVSKDQEKIGRENRQLAAEVRQLDDKIRQLAVVKRGLEKQVAQPAASAEKAAEAEAALAEANAQNEYLDRRLAELQARLAALSPPVSGDMPSPRPGSDLFRELENENALLKTKLVELDKLRQRELETLARKVHADRESVTDSEQLEGALAEANVRQKQQRKVIEKLVRVIPKLEKELEQKESEIKRTEQDMEELKQELKRREQRVVKAQRMAGLLDRARDEVDQVKDVESRDMNYNMALVYMREGRYRDAEQAYLRALQLDPSDPDIHYNLAILYDDELEDQRRALMHYRKYLRLDPYAEDQSQVKLWIISLETDLRE
jgi:tetratricopeptide (TPR) repeat protein